MECILRKKILGPVSKTLFLAFSGKFIEIQKKQPTYRRFIIIATTNHLTDHQTAVLNVNFNMVTGNTHFSISEGQLSVLSESSQILTRNLNNFNFFV
jgi:hypothetical protein